MVTTKEGKSTIVGNAGEYLVVGELLRRGVVAAPAPRNTTGFDVLATKADGSKSMNIRVKTMSPAAKDWVWTCKDDIEQTIFKNMRKKSDFTVLVDLGDWKTGKNPPKYYVVPTVELDRRLKEINKWWVDQPPKRGNKPHNPNDRMRRIGLTYPHHKDWILEAEGDWQSILSDLEA